MMNEIDAGTAAEKIAKMLFTDSVGNPYTILQQIASDQPIDNGRFGLQLGSAWVVDNVKRILMEG
jgi:hypothetical protein